MLEAVIGIISSVIIFFSQSPLVASNPPLVAVSSFSAQAQNISESEYGQDWPFTVSSGILSCDREAVGFIAGGKKYALNGIAKARPGYDPNLYPIWRFDPNPYYAELGMRVSVGPMIQKGLGLCH